MSVGVDIFDRLYLKEQPISLPTVPTSSIKQIYDKYDYLRKIDKNRSMWKFWWIIEILCLGYPSPMEKLEKSKNDKWYVLMNFENNVFDIPVLLREYYLFSQNTESSLEE